MYEKRRRRRLRPAAVLLPVLLIGALALSVWLIRQGLPGKQKQPAGSSKSGSSSQKASSAAESSQTSSSASALTDSLLMIVNKENPVPDGYNPTLVTVPAKYYISADKDRSFDARAATYLENMMDAAASDGISLCIVSGHRTKDYQQMNYDRSVSTKISQGYTRSEAESMTAVAVAPPGYSEHETGLACDFGYNGSSNLTSSYDKTPAFAWLTKHCTEYGFILRYPKDKESITQYEYEPWHYRFVGVENAKKIQASGLCLEEYVQKLKNGG